MKTLKQLATYINNQDGYPSDICTFIDENNWHSDDENVLATDGKMNLIVTEQGTAVLKPVKELKSAKMMEEARRSLGLTKRQAAKISGVSFVTLTRVESSQMVLSTERFMSYMDSLGYEVIIQKKQ